MGLLKVIECPDVSSDIVVHKLDLQGNVIKRGSTLTVREGQSAVFCDKGRMADVFGPGMYKLDTDSLPIVTKLLSWKFGFETPFKSDVYFVQTRQFTNLKWGTSSPILVPDPRLGNIRVRGYGTYAFRIVDPAAFLTEISGTSADFSLRAVSDTLRGMLVAGVAAALGSSGLHLDDLSRQYASIARTVADSIEARLALLGLELTAFDVESLSVPTELEKAVDENARLSLMRDNVDVYTSLAQADALKEAAKHNAPTAAVVGVGLGTQLAAAAVQGAAAKTCPVCRAVVGAGKFCPECGAPLRCPKCGSALTTGAKFCPECGEKLGRS